MLGVVAIMPHQLANQSFIQSISTSAAESSVVNAQKSSPEPICIVLGLGEWLKN